MSGRLGFVGIILARARQRTSALSKPLRRRLRFELAGTRTGAARRASGLAVGPKHDPSQLSGIVSLDRPAQARQPWSVHEPQHGRLWLSGVGLPIFLLAGSLAVVSAQNLPEYELPPIRYSATEASNRVTALQRRLQSGQWQPHAGSTKECLRDLLEALDVPVASQVLVFSKTSLQRSLIEPRRPRALYFNDDVYIGWVPGGLMEVTCTDPQLGLAFYRFDALRSETRPELARDTECLSCHGGSLTRDWPGVLVRSVFADARGEPIVSAGTYLTGHESPFEERWGGWYVTGNHGSARHLGNVVSRLSGSEAVLDREAGANLTELSAFFEPGVYLRGDSDLVALMVFEHQVNMHSRLVHGALRVRKWMDYQRNLQRELKQPVTDAPEGTALRVVQSETERIVEYLLFCEEAPLPAGGIHGAGDFEEAFRARRRPDERNRSLRDFDLRTRLFTWRCSYMIEAEAFDSLPEVLRHAVYRRLRGILSDGEPPPRYRHLEASERAGLREILTTTKPELASVWAQP